MSDYHCGLRKGARNVEVVQINRHGGCAVVGEIPRICLEAIGVDCSPLDRRDAHGQQGTVWIRVDQSEQMRGHKHWRNVGVTP